MATLKIRDLSVGDWVMCNEDKYRVMGITMFHELDLLKSSEGFRTSIDNIEPIPITAEILEKNGFLHNGKKWYTPELFTLERGLDYWDIVIACACGNYVCEVCTIKYVHQLQHALRLAGVDKEINL